ncbi:hypothetical protein [Nitrolancea hollandica]|uniref:Uncharacterized protein n=1 Tax=Nitrolancea hollandica Lb TaxID=1129897 RepID=I4EL15_9BACT|nr:hypothetical protein [Nitrolancea hollandica]CCF85377.1 hypothetical protein NITHO_4890006 [Nitrolancea hollandica Lb]
MSNENLSDAEAAAFISLLEMLFGGESDAESDPADRDPKACYTLLNRRATEPDDIYGVGWHGTNGHKVERLSVKFLGGKSLEFAGVPFAVYNEIAEADNTEAALNEKVFGKYPLFTDGTKDFDESAIQGPDVPQEFAHIGGTIAWHPDRESFRVVATSPAGVVLNFDLPFPIYLAWKLSEMRGDFYVAWVDGKYPMQEGEAKAA